MPHAESMSYPRRVHVETYERTGFPAHVTGSKRSGAFSVVTTEYAGGTALPPHAHREGCLIAVVSGRFDDVVGRRRRRFGEGAVFSRTAEQKHANRFDSSMTICLNVPVETDRDRAIHDPRLVASLLAADDDLAIECAVGEALLALREAATAAPSPRVALARELAEDAFASPLTLSEVAREVGMHPAHLARDFRRAYASTFGEYVRSRRVAFAAAELRDGLRPLADISLAAGFYDQSHLTKAFRRVVGTTPGRFRRNC
jgi:AraC family transcriptional regulator